MKSGKHDRGDAGLEADEDGKAADEFDQADDDSRDRRNGQADAAEPAGGAGDRRQLAEAGEDEHDGQADAADEDRDRSAAGVPAWPAVREEVDILVLR